MRRKQFWRVYGRFWRGQAYYGGSVVLETMRRVKDFGEDWSSVGKVLGMGVGVKHARKDMNTEGFGGSQEERCPKTHCSSEGVVEVS